MKISKMATITTLMLVVLNVSANTKTENITHLSHFEENNVPLPENLKKINYSDNNKQASTTASANYANGTHGTNIRASGNVGYQIYNGRETVNIITWIFICAFKMLTALIPMTHMPLILI